MAKKLIITLEIELSDLDLASSILKLVENVELLIRAQFKEKQVLLDPSNPKSIYITEPRRIQVVGFNLKEETEKMKEEAK